MKKYIIGNENNEYVYHIYFVNLIQTRTEINYYVTNKKELAMLFSRKDIAQTLAKAFNCMVIEVSQWTIL